MMTDTVVLLVHGFNVSRPLRSIAQLRSHFEALGCLVEGFNYGDLGLFAVRKNNHRLASKLAERCRYWKEKNKRVIICGHSNGSAITRIACKYYGAEPEVVEAINPALWRVLNPAPTAKVCHVWFNKGDTVGFLAKVIRWLTPLKFVNDRPWGEMGRVGFVGPDSNVFNLKVGHHFLIDVRGHSGIFKKPESEYFLPLIAQYAFHEVTHINQAPLSVLDAINGFTGIS
jgi:hypothetical protein